MHPRVFQEFERICAENEVSGSVLEVGAVPSNDSLLCMKALGNATEKIGLNLMESGRYMDFNIVKGNANHMASFENDRFDATLCNSVLEHDKFFWKTLSEMKRVTKPGGLIVIGTPGYSALKAEKLKSYMRKIPLVRKLRWNQYLNMFFTATITFEIHNAPGDYYRFSPQAYKEVFFEGLQNVEVRSIMLPPRVIGVGTKA